MLALTEGKTAMAVNPGEFNWSASEFYAEMSNADKADLKSVPPEQYKSKKDVVRQGGDF